MPFVCHWHEHVYKLPKKMMKNKISKLSGNKKYIYIFGVPELSTFLKLLRFYIFITSNQQWGLDSPPLLQNYIVKKSIKYGKIW